MMKLLLKILAAPIVAILAIFVWFCTGILYISGWVFGIAGILMGICAVYVFLTNTVVAGIIFTVLAVLVSPFGIPMIAAWLLARIQGLRYAIQERVYK